MKSKSKRESYWRMFGREYRKMYVQGVGAARSDFSVCYLDADVPDGITFYKILPEDFHDYIGTQYPFGDRTVHLPAVIHSYHTGVGPPSHGPNHVQLGRITAPLLTFGPLMAPYTTGDRADYWAGFFFGDSGDPTFIIIDGELVLLGLHELGDSTSLIDVSIISGFGDAGLGGRSMIDIVNELMKLSEVEGGGSDNYGLTYFDFSSIRIPPTRFFNLASSQSLVHGTVSAQSLLHGTVSTQTRLHGIISSQSEPS